MADFSVAQRIAAPRAAVWAAIIDGERLPAWLPGVRSATPWTTLGVGGRRRLGIGPLDLPGASLTEQIFEWVDGSVLGYGIVASPPLVGPTAFGGHHARFTLTDATGVGGGAATDLAYTGRVRGRLAGGNVTAFAMTRQFATGLRTLARLVEG